MFFDPLYFILLTPAILLSLYASFKVKSTFGHYSQIPTTTGYTGAQAARAMLQSKGIYDVTIEYATGFLGDHYDPRTKTLRLSRDVHDSRSVSAIGVACHEAGHAIQHAEKYAMLEMRSSIVPAVNVCSNLSMPIIFIGLLMRFPGLMIVGVILFAAVVVFSLITLPVEWDASRRAKLAMQANNMLTNPDELEGASKVLNAAFLTYLAAAISAILTLVYYLMRSGLLGSDD